MKSILSPWRGYGQTPADADNRALPRTHVRIWYLADLDVGDEQAEIGMAGAYKAAGHGKPWRTLCLIMPSVKKLKCAPRPSRPADARYVLRRSIQLAVAHGTNSAFDDLAGPGSHHSHHGAAHAHPARP